MSIPRSSDSYGSSIGDEIGMEQARLRQFSDGDGSRASRLLRVVRPQTKKDPGYPMAAYSIPRNTNTSSSSSSVWDPAAPLSPGKLKRMGSSSLRERLSNLSTLLAEERKQRAKKRVQMAPPSVLSGDGIDTLQGVQKQHHERELRIRDDEIYSLRQEIERQRHDMEAMQQALIQQRAPPAQLDMEVEALMQELQGVKEELVQREYAEQRAMEEAAQLVVALELEMENLTADYEESQVEILHLRRMLQKHDAALQDASQQQAQRHKEEVIALAHTVEETQRDAGARERDLTEANHRIRRLEEEVMSLRAQLRDSLAEQLEAEKQFQLSFKKEKEMRAAAEEAAERAGRLEKALQSRATEAEISHASRDEAFLRMTQAVEQKSEENARLLLVLREQRRQLDLLQDQIASGLVDQNAERDHRTSELQRVVDLQARLLKQKEEELQKFSRVGAAKDRQLMLLQAEVRRLNSGQPLKDVYPRTSSLTSQEIRTLPIFSDEQKLKLAAYNDPPLSLGMLAGTTPAGAIDDDVSARTPSPMSGTARLYELRCELEEARLKRERLTQSSA